MDLLFGFGIFLGGVLICMIKGLSLMWALILGFAAFFVVGLKRGFSPRVLLGMAWKGAGTSFVVMPILISIGVLTGLWRGSGTIAYFVAVALEHLTPHSFILVAFLLTGILSLAFGSSFGVSGTAGVILMTIARTGGADLAVTAGAAMSGAYLGERLSPASSALALAAAVSETEAGPLQRRLWRDTFLPLGLTLAIYALLSWLCPIQQVDPAIRATLEEAFVLNGAALLPAAALLILPWFRVKALHAIGVSSVLAGINALAVQRLPVGEVLKICLLGYEETTPALREIMSGGGLISMRDSVIIVLLSCAYAGIFTGTGILDPVKAGCGELAGKIGRIPTLILVTLSAAGLFCNQAVVTVMSSQIFGSHYRERGLSGQELARDISNTGLNLAGLVPWCIACSVPLANMDSGPEAIPFAVYLYLVPLCAWAAGKKT